MKNSILIFTIIFIYQSIAYNHPGQILNSFSLPYKFCTGLTYDGKNLWIAEHQSDLLVCIDPQSGQIVRKIASPGFWPIGLTWDGKYLWNVDKKQKKIFKIDANDGTILFAIESPTEHPEGLAWDGRTLWLSDPKAKKIMKLDLSDGTAVKTIKAPAKSVQGLTFDGTYLWSADRYMDELYMIDPESGEVLLIIKTPDSHPRGLAWDGKNLWNIDYQTDKLYQLVRKDDDLFQLQNMRKARITFTHELKVYGSGYLKSANVYIAIPENMPQQHIVQKQFIPNKFDIIEDRWNQKIAYFSVENMMSETIITSKMSVEAEISDITYYVFPDRCGNISDIPSDIRKKYTVDGTKYLIHDPYIHDLAQKIVENEENPYWIARKIFNYVRENLEYKLEGGWNVAPYVLKRGTGSCSEYTFSFIALCRAAGLPARYVGSIVVRGDDASLDEVFHRWPEVYLPNYGWIPIDPQGGDKFLARDIARNIGHLSNRFLITTRGGGDSEFLGWYYISNETYETDPKVLVNLETFAEWEPLEAINQKISSH
jgi:transglutaminase-like putative cysteine protease/glutamine cyclotransferase